MLSRRLLPNKMILDKELRSGVLPRRSWRYLWRRAQLLLRYRFAPSLPLTFELKEGPWYRLFCDDNVGEILFLENTNCLSVRSYDPAERLFVSRFLQSGEVFFDVGANSGLYSLIAALSVGSSGAVHAFEPAPSEFRRLEENIKFNRFEQVNIVPVAIGSHNDQTEFWPLSGRRASLSSLRPLAEEMSPPISVEMRTLDNYIQSSGVKRLDLCKIDVEGAEPDVLAGGVMVFGRGGLQPVVICELADKRAAAFGRRAVETVRRFESLGYRWYCITYDGLLELAPRQEKFDCENWVASPIGSNILKERGLIA